MVGGGGGGGGSWPGEKARRALLLALALGSLLAQPCRASFFFGVRRAYTVQVPRDTGGHRDEKVPMTVVVPDYSPRPAPLAAAGAPAPAPFAAAAGAGAPAPAPAPVHGSDPDGMPKLPSERRVPLAPSSGNNNAGAEAPTSTDFISSSPAVPLPAGVTDSATVLPMPTPGQQRRRDDTGMGARQLQAPAVQLAVPLLIMLSLGPLW
ncbi:hypothetical protein EJB05_38030 [Eragrostis curvula]|uniref:Uncharacterized protein n=1 Tax=Eragrostis curvula TaxID=38414 RepID=A0A5J9TTE6_9POAL|nr:hypothetical protein EJB05_38030 [Eragrostis curvula]